MDFKDDLDNTLALYDSKLEFLNEISDPKGKDLVMRVRGLIEETDNPLYLNNLRILLRTVDETDFVEVMGLLTFLEEFFEVDKEYVTGFSLAVDYLLLFMAIAAANVLVLATFLL